MPDKKVVLVTGASVGFGRQIARLLAQAGHIVYGTSRKEMTFPEYRMLVLDVRSDDSVRRGVEAVLAAEGRIDVLVNNAGYLLSGLIEEVSVQEARDIFETNFFGCHRMIQAVLPAMRARRCGQIVTIGSLGGLVSAPGHGFYYATKFALEGYAEALHHEVRSFGIKVTLIEPGYFKTNLHKALFQASARIPDYDTIRTPLFHKFEKGVGEGDDPVRVARLVRRVIDLKSPKLRYRIGPGAAWIPLARFLLPQKLFAWATRRYFHLPE